MLAMVRLGHPLKSRSDCHWQLDRDPNLAVHRNGRHRSTALSGRSDFSL